jgi:hypothetical protein
MSINGSSAKDLAAALRANGVDDPEKWARLIVEHAPYPPNDPGLTALRQVLTGAQADPHTVDQIVAVLRP